MPRLALTGESPELRAISDASDEVRGVWIATVFNIDYPSAPDLSAASLKREIDGILNACVSNRLNTVYFQARPSCDALYNSDMFPVSSFLNSEGKLTFDPLGYIVSEAHKRGISVHAWVNPLRITTSSWATEHAPNGSPASVHKDWTVNYDGKLYFNAGIPEVRKFVADGVREIVSRYDVDGIVYDDYFYPYPVKNDNGETVSFNDENEYKKYGGESSLSDWRRENINALVRDTYDAVKETDPECLFGVSPAGVWRNDDGSNGGSSTRGFEAYESIYCDALAWIDGGYVDYVSPQIYWTFDTAATPFDTVVEWWNGILDGAGVDLIVSHGAYRYEEGDWSEPYGEMKEQVEYSRKLLSYRGSMFYGFDEIRSDAFGISSEITDVFSDDIKYTDAYPTGEGISFTSFEEGEKIPIGQAVITGESDPSLPFKSESGAASRRKDGSFSVTVNVERGENQFIFRLGDKEYSLALNGGG